MKRGEKRFFFLFFTFAFPTRPQLLPYLAPLLILLLAASSALSGLRAL